MIVVYKPIGLTPLQIIKKLKILRPELKNEKISYAGRLDPMAQGVLLLLIGEENKKRKSWEKLRKEYVFDCLFGVETDTYDVLGIVKKGGRLPQDFNKKIKNISKKLCGRQKQKYPPFSSYRINGKPLFYWARENKLTRISIPCKEIEIYDFRLIKSYKIASLDLNKLILERVKKVKGNFRQDEILKRWCKFFDNEEAREFQVLRFWISCSSGTYVRSIAHRLGKDLGVRAIALEIVRTKVGKHSLKEAFKMI